MSAKKDYERAKKEHDDWEERLSAARTEHNLLEERLTAAEREFTSMEVSDLQIKQIFKMKYYVSTSVHFCL